jgi:hypothetical protein
MKCDFCVFQHQSRGFGFHLQQAFFVSHAQWHAQIGCAPGGTDHSQTRWRPVWRLVNDSCLGCVRNKKGQRFESSSPSEGAPSVMTSYNRTVQDFSDACFRQLAQPLSTIDAINYGTGVTLVR